MIPVLLLARDEARLLGRPAWRHVEIAAQRAGLPVVESTPASGDVIVVAHDAVVTHAVLSALAAAQRAPDEAVLDAAGVAARIDARWLDGTRILRAIVAGRPQRLVAEAGVPLRGGRERRRAEDVLLRAATKPLRPDDHLGAFTRELTLPVVRWLAPTGVTPNMVTIAGFVITIASVVPLAAGGYRWMLAGAVLQWIGSMADAVDGKLARVTGQITERGGWLDTRIDEVYYLLLFGATSIGLARDHSALAVGSVGLVVLSGLLVSLGLIAGMRRRTPDGRTASFGKRVHATLDHPGGDRILWIGRKTIRLGTRAGLPHVFLALAIAGALPLFGVLAAIGTHVAWIVVLRIDRALTEGEVQRAA